jgi:hypothetical protein
VADVVFRLGAHRFAARFETAVAPRTCAAFRQLLPFTSQVIHVRWSGEALWAPLGDLSIGVTSENATSYPHPGEVLWYPGGVSETELLIAYGRTHFASKAGPLAGNHFLTITDGLEQLPGIGRQVLWQGAQPLEIALA